MTNLNRWDPFQDMLTLREAMSQLLEDSFVQPSAARGGQSFIPAVDLSETEDGFLVEAVVPGLKPEDLEIVCENNVLTIKGQVRQQTEDRKRHYHRVERRFGTFERSIGLPSSVKTDAIQANLTNGVLRLEIPKAENVKPRRINVNIGESKQIEAGKK
jgi:HSP20 family protein